MCVRREVPKLARESSSRKRGASLGGGFGGSATGALLSGSASGIVCAGLSIPTGGIATVLCGILVVGAGSFAGGKVGEKGGEIIGELIYGTVK